MYLLKLWSPGKKVMHEHLRGFINLNILISSDQLDQITGKFKPVTIKKNTILLSQGEVCNKLYFVNKGCIRTYYLTGRGDEKTRYVAFEGMIVTALNSFISQRPSFEFVDALEDSDLLYITHSNFYQLAKEIPAFREFYLKLLELSYLYQNKKIEELVTLSAGERYALLLKEHPAYVRRLSNKILASYLDITQETLSRLKSK